MNSWEAKKYTDFVKFTTLNEKLPKSPQRKYFYFYFTRTLDPNKDGSYECVHQNCNH